MKITRQDSKERKYRTCWFGIALFLLPCLADAVENPFIQARTAFMQAVDEQDGALKKATQQFMQLSHHEPENPVYLGYLGACATLQGRDAWMPWNKIRYTEQGLDIIDKALSSLNKYHDDKVLFGASLRLHTMMIAAMTFIYLPDKIFHRYAKGVRLLGKIKKNPTYESSSPWFKKSINESIALTRRNGS